MRYISFGETIYTDCEEIETNNLNFRVDLLGQNSCFECSNFVDNEASPMRSPRGNVRTPLYLQLPQNKVQLEREVPVKTGLGIAEDSFVGDTIITRHDGSIIMVVMLYCSLFWHGLLLGFHDY